MRDFLVTLISILIPTALLILFIYGFIYNTKRLFIKRKNVIKDSEEEIRKPYYKKLYDKLSD